MEYVTLLGTDDVKRAASRIQEAAESMSRSVGYLDEILQRNRVDIEEMLCRFERAVESRKVCPRHPDQPIPACMVCRWIQEQ